MFAGVAGSMPRQSRPSRLRRGSPCWLLRSPGAPASIHLTLKGQTSLAGGSPLVATRSLPMDTQAIRAQMPTLVVGHVPSNVRSFKFNIFDGQPKVSTLGFHIDPKPFEGKRSAERRVGKECGSTWKSRWSSHHSKKKNKKLS